MALYGQLSLSLWVASAADGKKLAEYSFDSTLVWDGMAAAYNRLYLFMSDGRVVALEGKE